MFRFVGFEYEFGYVFTEIHLITDHWAHFARRVSVIGEGALRSLDRLLLADVLNLNSIELFVSLTMGSLHPYCG